MVRQSCCGSYDFNVPVGDFNVPEGAVFGTYRDTPSQGAGKPGWARGHYSMQLNEQEIQSVSPLGRETEDTNVCLPKLTEADNVSKHHLCIQRRHEMSL